MAKQEWREHKGRWIRPTKLPGVWQVKDEVSLYLIRARQLSDKTGKLREVRRFVRAESPKAALDQLERAQAGSSQVSKEPVRFRDYAKALLARKIQLGEIKANSYGPEKWGSILEHHLYPAFGDYYMHALSGEDIEAVRLEWARLVRLGDYLPTTVNGWLRILSAICTAATKELRLPQNPYDGVKPLDESEHDTYAESNNAVPPGRLAEFLDHMRRLSPRLYGFAFLGFAIGARPSSLRPLRRCGPHADLDWETGVLLLRRSATKPGVPMARTKTGRDQRIVLPGEALDELRTHVAKLTPLQAATDLLFPSPAGRFWARQALEASFARTSEVMGLPRVTSRAMRRTFMDTARAAQVESVVTRSISGHRSEAERARYSTVGDHEQRQAIAGVVSLMRQAG